MTTEEEKFPNGDPSATDRSEQDSYREPREITEKVDQDHAWLQEFTIGQDMIERNFPANIITMIQTFKLRGRNSPPPQSNELLVAMIYKQAELAILQIERHNQRKPFDSVSVLAAYEAGEGRIK